MKQLKVVLIGGGTGFSMLARGLREYPIDIIAIVTVASDGGGTSKIRGEMSIPAPGDIRNVIAALSDVEPVLEESFQYRFEEHQVEGHSLGNLLLAALTDIKNDSGHTVKELNKILNIKGKVIPPTNTNVMLNAVLEDGKIVEGESKIPKKNKKIRRVYLESSNVEPMQEAVDVLQETDLTVLGPGSLYTSIISNLCIEGISKAIINSQASKLYISNIMTQPGETSDYDVYDHIKAIHQHVGKPFIDHVICSNDALDKQILQRYRECNAHPVNMNKMKLTENHIKIITSKNPVEVYDHVLVRRNTEVLANLVYDLALELTSTIQFKPKK